MGSLATAKTLLTADVIKAGGLTDDRLATAKTLLEANVTQDGLYTESLAKVKTLLKANVTPDGLNTESLATAKTLLEADVTPADLNTVSLATAKTLLEANVTPDGLNTESLATAKTLLEADVTPDGLNTVSLATAKTIIEANVTPDGLNTESLATAKTLLKADVLNAGDLTVVVPAKPTMSCTCKMIKISFPSVQDCLYCPKLDVGRLLQVKAVERRRKAKLAKITLPTPEEVLKPTTEGIVAAWPGRHAKAAPPRLFPQKDTQKLVVPCKTAWLTAKITLPSPQEVLKPTAEGIVAAWSKGRPFDAREDSMDTLQDLWTLL